MGKLIPAHCHCHCVGWLAGCISHRRQDAGRMVCIAGRLSLFNGLAANDSGYIGRSSAVCRWVWRVNAHWDRGI